MPLMASHDARVRAVAARLVTYVGAPSSQSEQRLTHAVGAARRGAARVHERRGRRDSPTSRLEFRRSARWPCWREDTRSPGADGHPLAAAADFTPGSEFDLSCATV